MTVILKNNHVLLPKRITPSSSRRIQKEEDHKNCQNLKAINQNMSNFMVKLGSEE